MKVANGRLRMIEYRSSSALVVEYAYNALGHRISWHYDTTRSGGGDPDGTVDANDPVYYFVHKERWQLAGIYRAADSDSPDSPYDASRANSSRTTPARYSYSPSVLYSWAEIRRNR